MTSGDVPERRHHNADGQTVSERDPQQSDSGLEAEVLGSEVPVFADSAAVQRDL